MKKYFIHNGNSQEGPYDLNELRMKNIQKSTPVWFDGMPSWKQAGETAELQILFAPAYTASQQSPPPPQNPPRNPAPAPAKKKSAGPVIALSITFGLIALIIIVAVIQKNKPGSLDGGIINEGNYQLQKMSIEETERSNPKRFLDATGTYRPNFWGDKFKLECKITNNATVASYKDLVLRVSYYSKTNTLLTTKDYVLYETLSPTSSKTFQVKVDTYPEAATIGWDVEDATAL